MSYENQLANALRDRGADENEVIDALQELRRHLASSGTTAEAEFGPAEQYAAALRPQAPASVRSPGRTVVVVGVVVALVYVVVAFAARPLLGFDIRTVVGPAILWPALVIVVVAVVAGILIDRRRKAPVLPERK